ncbi:MAG: efflux RND transporter permease subunit, partial [Nitrospirota bacterium]
ALATGAGAESRRQIGWVIVGGLLLGTMLTLFIIPTAYTLLARRRQPAPAGDGHGWVDGETIAPEPLGTVEPHPVPERRPR